MVIQTGLSGWRHGVYYCGRMLSCSTLLVELPELRALYVLPRFSKTTKVQWCSAIFPKTVQNRKVVEGLKSAGTLEDR